MRLFSLRISIISHDLFMIAASFVIAFLVRFNLTITQDQINILIGIAPIVLLIQGLILWWSRLYRGVWRFSITPDLWNIIRAAAIGSLAVSLA